ncbi:Fcf1-domain-containing protein [Mycotypha africana]|uniref:Fcf1-domain-containing protein n=1 Tax=Mycotypha africana TaxID=64632 RepID=UPI002300D0EE|nr:Fcf1-domain-containing protein [Mycotypha africana]KAI8977089.1 Fcf1-domain-containing protein [Mycotypha africana]
MTKVSRTIKKIVHGYSVTFGFRPPYQIVLDGEFCKAALKQEIYIKDALSELMNDTTRIFVTECILKDIKDKGHEFTSAYILAKRFEVRKCPHHHKDSKDDSTLVSAYQCIRDLVGKENNKHYCVASQQPKLRDRMRKIPGVPIIYVDVKHKRLGLEPMTDRTKKVLKEKEIEKETALDKETARLKKALFAEKRKERQLHQRPRPKGQKQKAKGVNPLAMKKRKRKTPPPPKNPNKKQKTDSNSNNKQKTSNKITTTSDNNKVKASN